MRRVNSRRQRWTWHIGKRRRNENKRKRRKVGGNEETLRGREKYHEKVEGAANEA